MPMKQIALIILGSNADPFEVSGMLGVPTGDILAGLNIEGNCLFVTRDAPNKYFAEEEVIYDKVTDGDRRWVFYPCVYGRCAG